MSTNAERSNGPDDYEDVDVLSDLFEDERTDDTGDLSAPTSSTEAAAEGEPGEEGAEPSEGKVHFDADEPLLVDAEEYRTRWLQIQTGFVDEPLYAVESAGRLLTEVLGDLASTFAHKRTALERQWRHGGDTSTDDLRAAFKNYRAFFNRVVST